MTSSPASDDNAENDSDHSSYDSSAISADGDSEAIQKIPTLRRMSWASTLALRQMPSWPEVRALAQCPTSRPVSTSCSVP